MLLQQEYEAVEMKDVIREEVRSTVKEIMNEIYKEVMTKQIEGRK